MCKARVECECREGGWATTQREWHPTYVTETPGSRNVVAQVVHWNLTCYTLMAPFERAESVLSGFKDRVDSVAVQGMLGTQMLAGLDVY